MVNGVTELIMMKSDVLDDFDVIKACVAYQLPDGTTTDELPYEIDDVKPVYKEFKGWHCDIRGIKEYDKLPQETRDYVEFIEGELETPIKYVSNGPKREEIIER